MLIKLIHSISTLPIIGQLVIIIPILFIIITRILEYNDYRIRRRNMTTNKTLTFLESVMQKIKHDSLEDMKSIMKRARENGILTPEDKQELLMIRLV